MPHLGFVAIPDDLTIFICPTSGRIAFCGVSDRTRRSKTHERHEFNTDFQTKVASEPQWADSKFVALLPYRGTIMTKPILHDLSAAKTNVPSPRQLRISLELLIAAVISLSPFAIAGVGRVGAYAEKSGGDFQQLAGEFGSPNS